MRGALGAEDGMLQSAPMHVQRPCCVTVGPTIWQYDVDVDQQRL